MKSTIDELIALQDDPLFDPERRRVLESEPEVAAQLRLLRSRRVALKELPGMQVPEGSWQRIIAAKEDMSHWMTRRYVNGFATAACAALVAILVVNFGFTPDISQQMDQELTSDMTREIPGGQIAGPVSGQAQLDILQRKSRHLEQALRRMPRSPVVRRVDIAGPIVTLQDRIAVVDYQLNQAGDLGLTDETEAVLWQRRVDLMNRLLRARYVESGYYAF